MSKIYGLIVVTVSSKVKVRFLLGGGVGRGILEFFCEKNRGPPTSSNVLMHDPSQTPTQKHVTLPPTYSEVP